MLYFLEKVYFLEYFSFAKIILHVIFFNCFDSDLFTGEFVHTKGYFTKSTFTYQFDEPIEIQSCGR